MTNSALNDDLEKNVAAERQLLLSRQYIAAGGTERNRKKRQ
jgi:hypothetical protein